jgi:AAA+ superfamily predicted ATPase
MVERSEALPPPDVYLEASATARAPSAALCAQYRGINDTIEKLRRERGAGNGERISELVTQRDALDPKLDRLLQGVSDTDPHQIPQCWKGVRVQIAPRAPLFDAILQLSQSLGRVIERIAVGEGKDPSEASLPIPSLIRDTKPASPYRIGVTSIDPTLLTQAPDAKRFLPSLLNNFHQLREALTVLYPNLLAAQLRPNPEHRALKSRVEGALGPVFLGDAEKTRAILAALTVSPSAELRSAQTKLLMTRSVNSRDGTFSLTLDRPDNVQLLAQTVQSYLFGSPDERSMVHRALESGSLKPVQGFCSRVQEALSRKQVGTLNRIFDQELVRTTQDPHAGLPELASVLFSLHSLAEEPESRRSLKGRLKNIAQIDHVAKALQNKISGEGSAASIFVEKTRARVARRFLADLNDYWGQEQLVSAMRSIFDGNLNLLRNPKAWAGIPAHKVMKNGILLHGDPGAGKTYLVTCAANEYELPLITITREEMAEAFERAGSTSAGVPGKERKGNDIEGTLATFMDGKLKAAAKEREKSGAIASILFIDEMEAEFLNRDPRTSQRSELTRTNIMLRVIERLITQHADIFFIGATNHIDQVDGAALRPGRFGIHLEVKLPNQEDAEAIVRGSLETLDLSLDPATSSSEAFQELTKECSGLSPHAITLSLNNTVALQRVAGSVTAVNETLLRAMKAAVAETRKQDHRGTLHGRTEPGR